MDVAADVVVTAGYMAGVVPAVVVATRCRRLITNLWRRRSSTKLFGNITEMNTVQVGTVRVLSVNVIVQPSSQKRNFNMEGLFCSFSWRI